MAGWRKEAVSVKMNSSDAKMTYSFWPINGALVETVVTKRFLIMNWKMQTKIADRFSKCTYKWNMSAWKVRISWLFLKLGLLFPRLIISKCICENHRLHSCQMINLKQGSILFIYLYIPVTLTDSVHCNNEAVSLIGQEGAIPSHVTDQTGCGSKRSPWLISAMSGQIIELNIIDFGSEIIKHRQNDINGLPLYGYIIDGDTRTSFCCNTTRKRHLYTSLSNKITIETLSQDIRIADFIIMYKGMIVLYY